MDYYREYEGYLILTVERGDQCVALLPSEGGSRISTDMSAVLDQLLHLRHLEGSCFSRGSCFSCLNGNQNHGHLHDRPVVNAIQQ